MRIKSFYGTSANAVKIQIWIAICVCLMVACAKKTLNLNQSLSRILQILSVNVFAKESLVEILANNTKNPDQPENPNKLVFNFL